MVSHLNPCKSLLIGPPHFTLSLATPLSFPHGNTVTLKHKSDGLRVSLKLIRNFLFTKIKSVLHAMTLRAMVFTLQVVTH